MTIYSIVICVMILVLLLASVGRRKVDNCSQSHAAVHSHWVACIGSPSSVKRAQALGYRCEGPIDTGYFEIELLGLR